MKDCEDLQHVESVCGACNTCENYENGVFDYSCDAYCKTISNLGKD